MTNQDTPTPRTDAQTWETRSHYANMIRGVVCADFASTLERELTAANGYAESLRVECEAYSRKMLEQADELAAARAEVEALRAALNGAMVVLNDGAVAGSNQSLFWLNQARAALTKEKA
jgi:hypothetical protein